MTKPSLTLEQELWKKQMLVCGIDEVGRGSFAGPLVSAGVILKPDLPKKDVTKLLSLGINDSKLLTTAKRKEVIKSVQEFILGLSVRFISVDIINEKGIGYANKLAFKKVAQEIQQGLTLTGSDPASRIFFLTDCFPIPEVSSEKQANIIRGDQISISIALASIIAKVKRDNYMEKLSIEFPEYGFEKHKGYGTKLHTNKIREYGLSEIHRKMFCRNYLGRIV